MTENDPRAPDPIDSASPGKPVRRHLSAWDWVVRVPLGFLWLVILLIFALPVCLYMTILYYIVQAWQALFPPRRRARRGRGGPEHRQAA